MRPPSRSRHLSVAARDHRSWRDGPRGFAVLLGPRRETLYLSCKILVVDDDPLGLGERPQGEIGPHLRDRLALNSASSRPGPVRRPPGIHHRQAALAKRCARASRARSTSPATKVTGISSATSSARASTTRSEEAGAPRASSNWKNCPRDGCATPRGCRTPRHPRPIRRSPWAAPSRGPVSRAAQLADPLELGSVDFDDVTGLLAV